MKNLGLIALAVIGAVYFLNRKRSKTQESATESLFGFLSKGKHADKIAKADFDTNVSIGNNSSFSVFGN